MLMLSYIMDVSIWSVRKYYNGCQKQLEALQHSSTPASTKLPCSTRPTTARATVRLNPLLSPQHTLCCGFHACQHSFQPFVAQQIPVFPGIRWQVFSVPSCSTSNSLIESECTNVFGHHRSENSQGKGHRMVRHTWLTSTSIPLSTRLKCGSETSVGIAID